MKNPQITILFLGLLLPVILTIAVPINDNPILDSPKESNALRALDLIHNDHSLSPASHPPAPPNPFSQPFPLSHRTPTSLTPRTLKTWTHRVLTTHLILPTKTTLHTLFTEINATMHAFIRFSETLDSYAPSSHIKLSYGALRLEFLSPAPIAWTVVAEIVKLHALLGMVFATLFSRVLWEYAGLVAVTVLFYAVGERPEGIIPV